MSEYKEKKEVKWAINLGIFLVVEEEKKKRRRLVLLFLEKDGSLTSSLSSIFYWFEVRFGIDSTSSRISFEKSGTKKNYQHNR